MTTIYDEKPAASKNSTTVKFVVFCGLVCVVATVYSQIGGALSLDSLAQRETELREYQLANPALVYGLAFVVYVLIAGLSLPGAAVLTLVYAWYFGFGRGLVLVSLSSTAGATVAFVVSRFLFRDAIQQRFGKQLASFRQSMDREGPFFLFTLRLIPAVPFFIINAVMGLTSIRTRTFWWISQLGMLPGTIVYVYAGSSVPSLQLLADHGVGAVFTPGQLTRILVAFAVLGLFPLLVRGILRLCSRKLATANHAVEDRNLGLYQEPTVILTNETSSRKENDV